MLDFSFAELALIVIVAVVFIGPKELPAVARALAKALAALRSLSREVRAAFDDLARESGMKDVTDSLNSEMRMIKGDDGKYYESYDLPLSPSVARKPEPEAPESPPAEQETHG